MTYHASRTAEKNELCAAFWQKFLRKLEISCIRHGGFHVGKEQLGKACTNSTFM